MLSKIFTTVALAASLVSAQTFTECDPTKRGEYLPLVLLALTLGRVACISKFVSEFALTEMFHRWLPQPQGRWLQGRRHRLPEGR
jgi:hypothetical protein